MIKIDEKFVQISFNNIFSSLNGIQSLNFYNSFYCNNLFLLIANENLLYKFTFNKDFSNFNSNKILNSKNKRISNLIINKNGIFIRNPKEILYKISSNENEINYNNFNNIDDFILIKGIISKKKIKQISCSQNEILFLTFGGMVYFSKNDKINEQNLLIDLLEINVDEIHCGMNFYLISGKNRNNENNNNNNNNVIFTWGNNSLNQCGINNNNNYIEKPTKIISNLDFKKISVGFNHTVILLNSNNNLIYFGDNSYKQCSFNNENKTIDLDINKSFSYDYFYNNNEIIIDLFTNQNSTLICTDKENLLFFGKICDDNNYYPKYFKKIENENVLKNNFFYFNDDIFILYNQSEKKLYSQIPEIKINEEETNLNLNNLISNKNEINNNNNNNNNNSFTFDELLQEQNTTLFSSTEPSENSLTELRNYINLLGISLTSNYENRSMSFRPDNLPPKSKEEEEIHRQLVHENRQRYLKNVKLKQELEKEHLKHLEIKHEKEGKRANFWLNEIIPNWTIMKSNKNFKHYFFEGIPASIRGQVWLLCVGNKFSITREYYNIEVKKSIQLLIKNKINNDNNNNNNENEDLNDSNILIQKHEPKIYSKYIIHTKNKEKSIHLIDLDINRTFVNLGVFQNNSPLSEDLREILRVFVVSRPDIGYVQGLSFIAGTLLLQMDKFQSFVCLMNIILNPNILPFFRLDEKEIKKRIELFNDIFNCNLPKLFEFFKNNEILPELYFIEWIMTLFMKSLNIDLAMRIWDIYFIEGIEALYKSAIVILTFYEKEFYNLDFEDILMKLQKLKEFKMNEDKFIDNMRNVKFTDKIMSKIQLLNEDYFPND